MEYIEGGTLWDVLESSPHDGKILEPDLKWWAPQIVSAINWCHSQGFVHRFDGLFFIQLTRAYASVGMSSLTTSLSPAMHAFG